MIRGTGGKSTSLNPIRTWPYLTHILAYSSQFYASQHLQATFQAELTVCIKTEIKL